MNLTFGSVIGGLIGAGFLALAAWGIVRGQSTESWPSTDGRLTQFAPPPYLYSAYGRGAFLYILFRGVPKPLVGYDFEVDGVVYHGTVVSFGPELVVKQRAFHPSDGRVRVFYNPKDPSEAVLQRGHTRMVWYQGLLGLTLFGFALYSSLTA